MSRNIAYVAVENALYHFDRRFSYRIPDGLAVQPGCRVVVPFGRGNSRRQGIVLDIGEDDGSELKDISELLDEEPVLSDEMLRLCGFMRSHCFCSTSAAFSAMLSTLGERANRTK